MGDALLNVTIAAAMEDVYTYAHTYYPYGGGDDPQQYDGDTANRFYLG